MTDRGFPRHPAPVMEQPERQIPPAGRDDRTQKATSSLGLPKHPPMSTIITDLQELVNLLSTHGDRPITMAAALGDSGYPSSTIGDGGSRGTDGTSAPERAVTADYTDQWAGVNITLATALASLSKTTKNTHALVANIVHHASDLDRVPVGTGECQACGRFCRPDKDHAGNRLRSGLCPTDYRAWLRANQPPRSDWVRTRRKDFTDDNGVLHTPEPDHDIDLSSERLAM